MANRIKTGKPVALQLNYVLREYLDDLIRSGLYGNAHTSAAEQLIRERIETLIRDGRLARRSGKLVDG